MSEGGLSPVNGVWKWIAVTLMAFMLGGIPGYVYQYLNAPSQEEVSRIAETQQLVLQRLVVLEEQIRDLEKELDSIKEVR